MELSILIAGYLVAYPALVWTLRDLGGIHLHLWDGIGNPHPWRRATVLAYAATGWPVIIAALVWRFGGTRRRLVTLRRRARRRLGS